MAQTQHVREVETNADHEAWLIAAANRKYHIHNGQVWSGADGMLFPLPALVGFASLPDSVRPFVFQACAQFATNRIGQTAEGDVAAAIAKAFNEGEIPSANSNNAFERHYLTVIGERVTKALGELPKSATKEDKEKRVGQIAKTAEVKRDGDDHNGFAAVIAAGIAAAKSKPVTEKKRVRKADDSEAVAI